MEGYVASFYFSTKYISLPKYLYATFTVDLRECYFNDRMTKQINLMAFFETL